MTVRICKNTQRGSSLLEFTLVGIGVVFVLIGTFEMARAMWTYTTLAHAAKETARLAIVHGKNCDSTCALTFSMIKDFVLDRGVGLDPSFLEIRLATRCVDQPGSGSTGCLSEDLNAAASTLTGNSTVWPSAAGNQVGIPLEVQLRYSFRSAFAFFWPGAGPGRTFGVITLQALSREKIEF